MSLARRLILVCAAALVTWAPFHFALQHRYELNAWKLWGLAMYAEPSPQRGLAYIEVDGQRGDVDALLASGCMSERDWNEHSVLGGLFPMAVALECLGGASSRAALDSYTYNVRTGRFRAVRHEWSRQQGEERRWRSYQAAERRW